MTRTGIYIKTPAEAKADLRTRGITVRAWAKEHGVSERIVHEVLAGRRKGLYGKSHKVAVLLGIKDGVLE